MAGTYDDVEIEDMEYEDATGLYKFPCPCGDMFEIFIEDLRDGSTDIATCPTCSLTVRVIFEVEDLKPVFGAVEVPKMEEQAPMAVAIAA